ncbi:MAG: DUF6949 family protein [Rhizobiaceae bacterium]
MPDWIILVFVVSCGFTLSGIAATALQLVAGAEPKFRLANCNASGILGALFIFMIAGPYMVLAAARRGWTKGTVPLQVLIVAACLVTVWSFCSGVFVFQALLITGIISV